MELKRHLIGQIHLPDGLVDITDPCYDADVWCRMSDVKVMPGTYNCYAYMGRNCWGTRCWFAQIVIADGPYNEIAEDKVFSGRSWRSIGSIGVDAGMAGFFHHKPDFNDEEWDIVCNAPRKSDADAYLESFSCNGENNVICRVTEKGNSPHLGCICRSLPAFSSQEETEGAELVGV